MLRSQLGASLVDVGPIDQRDSGHSSEIVLVESYRPTGGPAPELELTPSELPIPPVGHLAPEVVGPGDVQVLGAVVIPADEVVFYLVRARSVEDVRRAFQEHGIASVRMVAAAWVTGSRGSAGPGGRVRSASSVSKRAR